MLLGLANIIDCPGGVVDFETSLDLSDLDFGGCCPAQEPVRASGSVRNTAGVLTMQGTVQAHLNGVCARCAADFERDVTYPLQAVLVPELASEENEDEWVFLLEGDCADLEDIIRSTFVLNMDTKLLCREDCKGLCCQCGANLNDGPCSCQPERDPRFAVLQQLLNKKEK